MIELNCLSLVYKDDVINLATECRSCLNKDCKDRMWRGVLILVPVRLGGEGLNPIYIPCIKVRILPFPFHYFINGICYLLLQFNLKRISNGCLANFLGML